MSIIFRDLEPGDKFQKAFPHNLDESVYIKKDTSNELVNAKRIKDGSKAYINPKSQVNRNV